MTMKLIDPKYQDLGNAIRTIRMNCGMAQNQLARHVGVTNVHINHLERGRSDPSLELLRSIAAALDCKLTITLTPNRRRQ